MMYGCVTVKKIAGLYRLDKKISSRLVEKSASGNSVMPVRYWKNCGRGSRSSNRNVPLAGHYTKPLSMRCLIAWN